MMLQNVQRSLSDGKTVILSVKLQKIVVRVIVFLSILV